MLADAVESSPRNSPLVGRYLEALRGLQEADEQERAEGIREAYTWVEEMFAEGRAREAMRVEMYRIAQTPEERERWADAVPLRCARNDHRPHAWPAGRTACVDCGLELPLLKAL